MSSILFTVTITLLSVLFKILTISLSIADMPVLESTRNRIMSASSIAISICDLIILSKNSLVSGTKPPVSISVKVLPAQFTIP